MAKNAVKNVPGKLEANPKANKTMVIKPFNTQVVEVGIIGIEPFVQNAFGQKAQQKMIADQQMTPAEKRLQRQNRKPKDFDACYEDAKHVAGGKGGGWIGIPCGAFRAGMVRACKAAGVPMTDAKMAILIKADGYDRADGTPLVRITKGEPHQDRRYARNDDGSTDIRARPMWEPGWEAVLRIEYDGDLISAESVVNLLERMGRQIGVGEGRNFSRSTDSAGMGWGSFVVDRKRGVKQRIRQPGQRAA